MTVGKSNPGMHPGVLLMHDYSMLESCIQQGGAVVQVVDIVTGEILPGGSLQGGPVTGGHLQGWRWVYLLHIFARGWEVA